MTLGGDGGGGRKVAVVGTREMTNTIHDKLREFMATLPLDTVIVSGGAPGVDSYAVWMAEEMRMPEPIVHRPDYVKYEKRVAPLERNLLIAMECTEMHAFPGPKSRGTWDAVNKARALGRPVTIHK